jgi:hypothetical protein
MHRSDARKLLPRLLEVDPPELKRLYRRLTGYAAPAATAPAAADAPGAAAAAAAPPRPPAHFGATQLLVQLHGLTPARDQISNKRLIAAIEAALHAPEVFKQEVVAAVSVGRSDRWWGGGAAVQGSGRLFCCAPRLYLTSRCCVPHPLNTPTVFYTVSTRQALQQLEGQSPLCHLFMRTVIVALQTHPKLMSAILGILTNLINKEVR